MSSEMTLGSSREYARARRAYEYGRLRSSVWRALIIAMPIGLAAWFLSGGSALAWLPLTFCAWIFAYWRGDALLRGSFYGLFGGMVTVLMPMSILRPCCAPGAMPNMGTSCCTMPGMCLLAGAVVGVVLATAVPFGKASWLRTASGIASMAIVKCATLFVGEAVGLLGGLIAGVIAASLAKSWLETRTVH